MLWHYGDHERWELADKKLVFLSKRCWDLRQDDIEHRDDEIITGIEKNRKGSNSIDAWKLKETRPRSKVNGIMGTWIGATTSIRCIKDWTIWEDKWHQTTHQQPMVDRLYERSRSKSNIKEWGASGQRSCSISRNKRQNRTTNDILRSQRQSLTKEDPCRWMQSKHL